MAETHVNTNTSSVKVHTSRNEGVNNVADVLVVGAGFGGLSAALQLQSLGFSTVLVDALDRVGGRAYAEKHEGFTFDRGPTIITAPFLIDELFEMSGVKRSNYVEFVPVDPYYNVVFSDGSSISHWNSFEKMCADVAAISPDDVQGVKHFFEHSEKIFNKGFLELGDKHFKGVGSMVGVAPDLLMLDAVRSVYSLVARYVKNEKVRQFLSFHPLLIGGNPFKAAGVYALINRLERAYGVHHAKGGMNALARAISQRFEELGGRLHLSAPVTQVEKHNGVFVVETPQGTLRAKRIVANADMANFVTNILKKDAQPPKLKRKLARSDFSMSAFLLYLGTTKQWPDMPQHSIVLGPRYKELINDIFKRRVEFSDYSMYLHMPTRTDSTLAPAGGEVIYTLVPVPHLASGTNWAEYGPELAAHVKKQLETRFLPGLGDHIAVERTFTPLDFQSTLQSHLGNAFGLEPHLLQSAGFRPNNRSAEIEGLYFVGASTQPGAGIPGVMLGARMTCELVAKDAGKENTLGKLANSKLANQVRPFEANV